MKRIIIQRSNGEIGSEGLNDRVDVCNQQIQTLTNLMPIRATSRTPLLELYLKCRCNTHLYYTISGRAKELDGEDYCAVFDWPTVITGDCTVKAIRTLHLEPLRMKNRERHGDASMFVSIVEIIEEPERSIPWITPVLVRLTSLKACPFSATEIRRDREFSGFFGYRKVNTARVTFVLEAPLPEEVIKGRPQLVDTLSNKQAPVTRGSLEQVECHVPVTGFLIKVGVQSIEFTLEESVYPFIKSFEVLTCPKHFEARTIKRMH